MMKDSNYIDFYRLMAGMQSPQGVTDVVGKPFCTKRREGQATKVTSFHIPVRGKVFFRAKDIYAISAISYNGASWQEHINLKTKLDKTCSSIMSARIDGILNLDYQTIIDAILFHSQMFVLHNESREESSMEYKDAAFQIWSQQDGESFYIFDSKTNLFKNWRLSVKKKTLGENRFEALCTILAPQYAPLNERMPAATFTMEVSW